MLSPIALQEFDEAKYRDFVQALTDASLIEEGKQLRVLCGNVATPIVGVFDQQLKICREEYRRRRRYGFLSSSSICTSSRSF